MSCTSFQTMPKRDCAKNVQSPKAKRIKLTEGVTTTKVVKKRIPKKTKVKPTKKGQKDKEKEEEEEEEEKEFRNLFGHYTMGKLN